ncbi:MAG: hypothetical protein JWM59_4279 [Verrucomicrobiales bacterium]|nr:hypothetical protein [Verrucomicrobiales bacterium]
MFSPIRSRLRLRLPSGSLLAAVAALFLTALPPATARQEEFRIPPATAQKIGYRIWQNECAGTVTGLTSWNRGEGFASLGIGHFIWYPAGTRRTYEESFPSLARFLAQRGARVPKWVLAPDCPWPDRASFNASANTPKMKELRGLLANTIALQGEFAAQRSLRSLPKILAAAPRGSRAVIESRFRTLSATPAGLYCLMDYVNFKGEGTNPAERYKGVGWGLLQVLENMSGTPSPREAPGEFAAAARRTLDRRIKLAPKDESQWRAGWFSRCASYARGL